MAKIIKDIYTQTFPEERVRIDNLIDDYFNSIVNPGESKLPEELMEEIKEIVKLTAPDQWAAAIINLMQHEMQHKIKRA